MGCHAIEAATKETIARYLMVRMFIPNPYRINSMSNANKCYQNQLEITSSDKIKSAENVFNPVGEIKEVHRLRMVD
jgi:hypothetical protein